jgi:hypothetical protein
MVVKKAVQQGTQKIEDKPKEKKQTTSSGTGYKLPTKPLPSVSDLGSLTMLLYGERKIGKTSLAAQFPGFFLCAFEKGFSGLDETYGELITDKDGKPGTAECWVKFKQIVNALVREQNDYKTIGIDTIDVCYDSCVAYVCYENGWDHPSDAAYGKGWTAVSDEFIMVVGQLVNRFGVIFISHAVEREFKDRFAGTFDKIVPTMTQQAKKYVSSVVDIICYYGYHGNNRLMTIRGSDSVESGNRLQNNFYVLGGKQKYDELVRRLRELKSEGSLTSKLEEEIGSEVALYRVHSVPCGIDAADAYYNFLRAFNNKQPDNGAPDRRENAVLSDVRAPMKGKK